MVNEELLVSFLQQATESLNRLESDGNLTCPEIRSLLMDAQMSTLSRIVFEYNDDVRRKQEKNSNSVVAVNVEDVQTCLKSLNDAKSLKLSQMAKSMNEAARLAFARLVLFSGFRAMSSPAMNLGARKSGELYRTDVLEFCGLCQSSLQLQRVQEYLHKGTPIFPNDDEFRGANQRQGMQDPTCLSAESSWTPHQRLRHIQSSIFQCLGYDPEFGHAQLENLFSTNNNTEGGNTQDAELQSAMHDMTAAIHVAINNAKLTPSRFSDIEEGGVTRVVGVTYSEKMINPNTGQILVESNGPLGAPKLESMDEQRVREGEEGNDDQQRQQQQQQNQVQVAAASLQSAIYQELVNMSDGERKTTLAAAQRVTQEFLQTAASLPPIERIDFLRSIDLSTQRLMIMHKLWTTTAISAETRIVPPKKQE